MVFTSFAQNQPNACEDGTKIFCNLLCVTVLKIPGVFVRKPGKREAKNFIKSRELPEPGSRFSNLGRMHTPHPTRPESTPGHKLQKPSTESGIFQSLGTISFVLIY